MTDGEASRRTSRPSPVSEPAEHPRHVVAVTGVVTDEEGRVLLVRGDHRGWEPPGGQVEHGEDLVSALQREVKEESGCEVEVMGLLGVYSNLGRPERGVPEQVHLVFGCEWVRGEPRAGNECLEAGWFGPEEALRLVEAPQQRAKLEDALAGSGLWYRAFRTQPYESVLDRRLDRKERNTCRPRRRPPTS